ncbi:hypothetical protein [Paenibacillus endoradicis]|uniref:hypothetical protein n=1 Tax=Paenibacillus endoradicis TaxID=2972487 RepID=UPI0021599F90|nr:hypothetical protein [Paenibacillus endoradicis]MCR8656427.1 hypothetical protein [Paenibacillus endoradicis]
MKNFAIRLIPATVHCILTLLCLSLLLKADHSNVNSEVTTAFIVLILTSAVSTSLICKGTWKVMRTSVTTYTLFALIFGAATITKLEIALETLFLPSFVFCLLVLSYSLLTIVIGTIIGIIAYRMTTRIIHNRNQTKPIVQVNEGM